MKVVIVSGYFDPVHVGHIELFEMARALGDKLVVILNNNKQCEMKKGKTFMPEDERKKILEALRCVDEVFVSIDTVKSVCESIRAVAEKYSNEEVIFANGGDRKSLNDVPEYGICQEKGVEMVDGLGEKIQSSSNLTGLGEIEKEVKD